MEWIKEILIGIGNNIAAKIPGINPVSSTLFYQGEETYVIDQLGINNIYVHDGQKISLDNSPELDGFHLCRSIIPLRIETISGKAYRAQMSLIVFGKLKSDFDRLAILHRAVEKKINCSLSNSPDVQITSFSCRKREIIQNYFARDLAEMQNKQLDIFLSEIQYTLEARNCKCETC